MRIYQKRHVVQGFFIVKLILVGLIALLVPNETVLQAQAPVENTSATSTVNFVETSAVNIVAHWKLDEVVGGTYEDAVGTLDGACVEGNCPIPTNQGRANGAQAFQGKSTSKVNVPADPILNWGPDDSFSIEFWMRGVPGATCAGSSVPGGNEVVVGRDDSTTDLHWWIGCRANGGYAVWRLEDIDGDSDAVILESGKPINDGLWHHIAAVRDGANKINRLYVDGIQAASQINAVFSTGFGSDTAALNIGWQNLSPYYYFEGLVDEIRIYNGALSSAEISKHATDPPTIISSPVTTADISKTYTYKVQATGASPLDYALVKPPSPNPMTINSTTGVITWVPSEGGDYNVTVKVSNSYGNDWQTFSVAVGERVYLPIIIR